MTMDTFAWLVGAMAMFPAFGIAAWLRFATDPVDDDLDSLVDAKTLHRPH